jgi:hypothetical protein
LVKVVLLSKPPQKIPEQQNQDGPGNVKLKPIEPHEKSGESSQESERSVGKGSGSVKKLE